MMKSILFFSFILFASSVMYSQVNNTTPADVNELALIEINELTEVLQLTAEQNEKLQIIVMGITRKNNQVQLMSNLAPSEIDNILIQNEEAKIRMIKGILEGKQVGLYENLLTLGSSEDPDNR